MNRLIKKIRVLLPVIMIFILCCPDNLSNKAEAASAYPYLIKVNKIQNCITVYEKDKDGDYTVPVKAIVCSTGAATPLGTFRTPAKYRWKILLEDVWGQYSTRIVDKILFHSVWYYNQDPSSLSAREYNKLGTMCSHGCIRVTVEDAKWIYDNCPLGTTVTIYNDSKSPGPLGKPKAIQLPAGTGWDPTDVTNPNNPFNKKKPSISGAENKTIKYGTKVDLKKGITAKSTTGFSITSDIKIKGTVNSKKAGKYKIIYSVTDLLNRKTSKTIYYTVLEDDAKPKIVGVKDRVIKGSAESGSAEISRSAALKGVTAKLGNKTVDSDNIKIKITDNKDDTYQVHYSYTAPNGKTAAEDAVFTIDRKGPEFDGIKDKEIAWDTVVDEAFVLEGVTIFDEISDMTIDQVTVSIEQNAGDTYTITYQAVDEVGNETKATAVYTITDHLKIEGVSDKKITEGTSVTEYFARQGVTAFDNGKDITDKMTVTISELVNNQYTVTYSVSDGKDHKETVTAVYTVE